MEPSPTQIEVFRRLPKVELHDHVAGSVRRDTIREFVEADGLAPGLADAYSPAARGEGLPAALTRFGAWDACVRTPERMVRVLAELREDLAFDGVAYAELRLRPPAGDDDGLWDALMAAAVDAAGTGDGPAIAFITVLLRGSDPAYAEHEARRAARWVGRGVVGFDIAGDERIDAAPLAPAVRLAREAGLGISLHAGETGGAASMRGMLARFSPDRFAHGVGAAQDSDLTAELRDRGIHLEMAITSNTQTNAVSNLADHPFPRLLRSGVSVGLNTDNRTICGTTLSREYALAADALGLSRPELARATELAARATFLPAAARQKLVGEIRDGWRPDPS